VNKAKYEYEMAKAQLEIREAELKEVEVKLKFAKKRLDDAKAAGVRPAPGVRPVDPKPVDPLPLIGGKDYIQRLAEMKPALLRAKAEAEKKAAEVEAELKAREAKLAKDVQMLEETLANLKAKLEIEK
jgi:hypothetical protein